MIGLTPRVRGDQANFSNIIFLVEKIPVSHDKLIYHLLLYFSAEKFQCY